MQYKIILFVVLIIHIGCSKNESEIDLLNKVDPIGYYGDHPPKGLIYSVDELLSSGYDKLGSDILVTGIITEVCPMRGCWLQVKDDNSDSSIRIKVTDGEIVFPLSARLCNTFKSKLISSKCNPVVGSSKMYIVLPV